MWHPGDVHSGLTDLGGVCWGQREHGGPGRWGPRIARRALAGAGFLPTWGACVLGELLPRPLCSLVLFTHPRGYSAPTEKSRDSNSLTPRPGPQSTWGSGSVSQELGGPPGWDPGAGDLGGCGAEIRGDQHVQRRVCTQLCHRPGLLSPSPRLWLQPRGGDITTVTTQEPRSPGLRLEPLLLDAGGFPRVWGVVGSRVLPQCGARAHRDSPLEPSAWPRRGSSGFTTSQLGDLEQVTFLISPASVPSVHKVGTKIRLCGDSRRW